MENILIKNGTIITLAEGANVLTDKAIFISDGEIKKIDDEKNINDQTYRVIDAKGKVIVPGFINAHMHFYSTLVRGLWKTKPASNFIEVLNNLWWKLDKGLTEEMNYYSALIVMLNGIRKGTTTYFDHHASPMHITGSLTTLAKAVTDAGLRASLCYEISDRDGDNIAQEGLQENLNFIKYCKANKSEQLKALVGLHASFTLSDETLEKAATIGLENDIGFHIHIAEGESDQEQCIKEHNLRVVDRLDQFGILGNNTIGAHCIHINEDEMDLLAESGTAVVNNPQSNLNNAVGISDIIKLTEKGALVGLGTDAMTVNMLEEMRVALWVQHLKNNNPSCGFMEVTSMLLKNNSAIAERYFDKPLGKICEGAHADIAIFNYEPPTPLDENTYLGHILYGLSQESADTTIAGGRVLMENKKLLLDINEEEVNAKARELTNELWKNF
ncbi:MAG TPA: putative aminohydrolase SsnA [Ignavibacteria bacterium]|nr:putative aminohydrolase SsnA [Ignavibacteria bacterium]